MCIDNKLVEFIKYDIARGKISDDFCVTDNLIETGIIDSLGIMKLIIFLENNYSIHVKDDDLIPENFDSISSIYSLIENKKD